MADWQPAQYLKYKSERTQPSVDLVGRIDLESPRRIIDIGCGPGNSTAILRARWPNAELYGLDNSPNMIEKARGEHPEIHWLLMSATEDLTSLGKFDVVFSNAALQWMPDHQTLIPNLYRLLGDRGVLAAQVPCVKHLPVYAEIQEMIQQPEWAEYFVRPPLYPKHFPYGHYYRIISRLTKNLQLWQTDYIHVMESHKEILEWYRGTGLRPFLDLLPDDALKDRFCAEYLSRMEASYPPEEDGRVLLPFTRIFFLASR